METKHTSTQSKIFISKKPSKANLAKLFTQRKSNPAIQLSSKTVDKPDKLPNLEYERQNPITYLQSIQSNHQQIQKSLDQSFLNTTRWRSYNSPLHTPVNQSKQKQNILFKTLYSKKKQISAIKVYNHVNNDKSISTKNFQQPQFLQFIQEAVSKSTFKTNFIPVSQASNPSVNSNTKRLSKLKKGFDIKQNYTIGDHRKELHNLQSWIKSKVQSYQNTQAQGETMFVERINFLNMAFSEVSRIAGTFSNQTKNIIEYLHKKYYDYYNFLTECMIEQNRKVKAEISVVQDRLLNTINYYEDKLKKFKQQNQQKSEKIVINFQKCIEVKKKLEKQNKEIKRNIQNQKKKAKLVQQALIKVINLFLALGQKSIQQMTFSLDSNSEKNTYVKNSMLAKSKKHILSEEQQEMQRRKQIFQQWCGSLIKMIHRILIKDICHKEGIDIQKGVFKKQAFDVIKQYMVENDDSLSLADADNILNNFLSSEEEEFKLKQQIRNASGFEKQIKQKHLKQLQTLNKKFQDMYSDVSYQLPTIQQVYNKITVHDVDIQVNMKNQTQNWGVQTHVATIQTGMMAVPKTKSREIDVSSHLKDKHTIQEVYCYAQVFKAKKDKQQRDSKRFNENKLKQSRWYDQQSKQKYNDSRKLSEIQQDTNERRRKNTNKSSFSDLVDILPGDSNFQEIGVNTIITRLTPKRTVQFIIPESENQQFNRNDTLISEDRQNQNKSVQSSKMQDDMQDKQSPFDDPIKQNETKSKDGSQKKFGRGRRKNGFLITGDKKKTHLSQRFIRSSSESSNKTDLSIESDQQMPALGKKQSIMSRLNEKQSSLNMRQSSLYSENSLQNCRISLDKETNLQNPFSNNQKKYQTLQQRLGVNRSFFNLSQVEYATKQEADVHRIKDYVIRVPKKKTFRQKFLIDPHDFHLELAFKNSEKVKFLSAVTLWHPKLMFEMKKIRHRVNNIKPLVDLDNKGMNLLKGYFTHIVNPLLKDLLKSYCHQQNNDKFDFGDNSLIGTSKGFKDLPLKRQLSSTSNGFKQNKSATAQLSYNQRLSPLLYNLINFTQYHQNKTSSDNQIFFSGLKTLRSKSSKMQIFNQLMEGRCVEVDIFVKTIYQFNLLINSKIEYNPEISYFILETGLIQALQGYFTTSQVQKIVIQAKIFIVSGHDNLTTFRRGSLRNQNKRDSIKNNNPKKLDSNAKIGYFDLLMIVFKHLKEKQENQLKKYCIIKEIICRNSECISYEDIMHFLQCLPIQNDKRKKILDNCLKHVVYWNSSQPTVPNDVFYFILDRYELYNSNNGLTQNVNLIKEYIINRCELYFKGTLQKVIKSPQWVLDSTYILSYKIPKLFHRILYQIKTGKNFRQKKLLYCLLTLGFCNLIDIEMEKRFMPSLFNGLLAIPLV